MTVTLGLGAIAGATIAAVAKAYAATSVAAVAASSTTAGAVAVTTTTAAGTVTTVAITTTGLAILGADETGTTFDCWKPVLHDTSAEPSNGKILKDVINDPRISRVILQDDQDDEHLPNISLVNIWGERFDIEYIILPSGQLCAHALRNDSVEMNL